MKNLEIMAAVLAVAGLTTGCGGGRTDALEQRVTQLEQRMTGMAQQITDLEKSNSKLASQLKTIVAEESTRRGQLQSCLSDADVEYDNAVIDKGKKERDGTYSVPAAILDELRRQKQEKIDQCKQLYAK